jgi:quercetin dioxygenase-like cupin family protein
MSPHFTRRYLTAAAIVAAAVPAFVFATAAADGHDRVVFITGDATRAAFAKGQPLVETAQYKVHASRRDAPGMAEVHHTDTDIIYVLDGTATLVTGGTVVGGTEVAAHEVRGRAIEGGTAQPLAKGDVVIVPNGVPHWFRDVQAPFTYYVVKTTGGAR